MTFLRYLLSRRRRTEDAESEGGREREDSRGGKKKGRRGDGVEDGGEREKKREGVVDGDEGEAHVENVSESVQYGRGADEIARSGGGGEGLVGGVVEGIEERQDGRGEEAQEVDEEKGGDQPEDY